ncbi:shikimate kinase [Cohnella nanjingensis]|uniref:shikimate kinase n=1 Tax=Cohnella nanjingensis TaxID=1387779 RepID=UPI0028A96981|nr:shikimate kinase [Cohnella nanjingensis]
MRVGNRVSSEEYKCRNVVLVGFMGTGKSTVSKLLADRLGWSRIDTDDEIARRAGRSIPEIFANEGESAFRELESAVIRDVLAGERRIVATGGGAVLREENRAAMLADGLVVALTADRETLLRRVIAGGEAAGRPLLAGDAEARIDALLAARRHAYDFAHVAVDTSGRTPEEIAELVLREVL